MKHRSTFVSNSSSSSSIVIPIDRNRNAKKTIGNSIIYLSDLINLLNIEGGNYSTVESELKILVDDFNHISNDFYYKNNYAIKKLERNIESLKAFDPHERLLIINYEWDDVNGPYYEWYEALISEYFDIYNWNVDKE